MRDENTKGKTERKAEKHSLFLVAFLLFPRISGVRVCYSQHLVRRAANNLKKKKQYKYKKKNKKKKNRNRRAITVIT